MGLTPTGTERLLNLVDLYIDKVPDIVQTLLADLEVLDKAPIDHLPRLEDVVEKYAEGEYDDSNTVIVSARIGDLLTSTIYNRGDSLRYGNQERDLNAMGGFSYSSCGVLSGYLRPTLDVVTTQGNNRTSMLFAVTQDRNKRVPLALKFHKKDASVEEMIRIESQNHHTDASFRTNQSTEEKFKSAYHSKQKWAVTIYNFLEPYSIGIAGTLVGAKFNCTSHSYVDKARKEAGEEYVKRYLDVHTDVFSVEQCEKNVYGNFVRGGSVFLKTFSKLIADVDEKNGGIDSFRLMMKHFFADREDESRTVNAKMAELGIATRIPVLECLVQNDITSGNRIIKGYHLFVCRLVSLYNEYCKIKELKYNNTYSTAIPLSAEANLFAGFVQDIDPVLRQSFIEVAKNPVNKQGD